MTHRLGLGCWPLSGAMFNNGKSIGYTTCPPEEAERILLASYDAGIRLFDTAHAYGCGHGERLIGRALAGRDIEIVTKIGFAIDEDTRTLLGPRTEPQDVRPAVLESLARLERERIDVVLLHPNELLIPVAEAMFDQLDRLVDEGIIGSFGWSTDFPERVAAQATFPRARHVEHVMNVFLNASELRAVSEPAGLTNLIRSPLAMGVLAGRFDAGRVIEAGDVRVESHGGMDWFEGAGMHPRFEERLAAVRELLQSGGRSLAQGALAWLWAHGDHIVPVPGASSVDQALSNAAALQHGPLAPDMVDEIAGLIPNETWKHRPL